VLPRIVREGRKYAVSLCLVGQRPSELDDAILSQRNTIFALRMNNERDQGPVSSPAGQRARSTKSCACPSTGAGVSSAKSLDEAQR
jgi:DNA helicase HerA-like ATPase